LRGEDLGPAYELAKYEAKIRDFLRPNDGINQEAQCANAIMNYLRAHANGDWLKQAEVKRGINYSRYGPGVFLRCIQALRLNDDIELDGKLKTMREADAL
jgi:hypothetical protein